MELKIVLFLNIIAHTIPTVMKMRQDNCYEFEANLGYIVSSKSLGLHSETLSHKTQNIII